MENLLVASSGIRAALLKTQTQHFRPTPGTKCSSNWMRAPLRVTARSRSNKSPSRRKLPKNLRNPRRAKLPPDPGIHRVPMKKEEGIAQLFDDIPKEEEAKNGAEQSNNESREIVNDDSGWSEAELQAISSLFERRMPQKPAKPAKDRLLPLPLSYKLRPSGIPTPKRHVRSALSSRSSFSDQVRKNPEALVSIAREIGALPPDADASEVLDRWARFLRKGSLSMTIRELGHMGLPERALQALCWAQKQHSGSGLFPDDRTLASTVEVMARFGKLKLEAEVEQHLTSASRAVIEAMVRGFIRAGNLHRARKILLLAKDNERTLDASIHAKLMLEAGKTPDGYKLASALLDELGQREDFDLKPQDCTAVMKVCIRLGKFEAVESLFNWFKQSGRSPTVVMYTTVIYSRYCDKKYREGLALVWEMEELDCLLDLPAYRVVIRLCVALNDLARAVRYFSRLKEAGFAPTYEIYRDMIRAYAASGRLAKCRQVCKEIEMAGLKLDKETILLLSEMEGQVRSLC